MAKPAQTLAPRPQLPQYVGPAEVCSALDISRSTLDRMRRDGKFPVAKQLSPNRVGWLLSEVQEHLSLTLVPHAKTDPAHLSDEQLETVVPDLAARLMTAQLGRPVAAGEVQIGALRPETGIEAAQRRAVAVQAAENAFAHLDEAQAVIVAAWQFPALREALARGAGPLAAEIIRDPGRLREMALRVLAER